MFGLASTARVEKLEDALRRLQSDFQEYELKYLNLHAKAKSLFGKIAKENARAEEKETAAELDDGQTPAVASSLSPRARLIQQQILARRAAVSGDRR